MHELSRVPGIEKLKNELNVEKDSHASSRDKKIVLVFKTNKWESEPLTKRRNCLVL